MSKRIAIVSHKGGTGRTTLALSLALDVAERGAPTVLVDLDPQGGLSAYLGRDDRRWLGLADHLDGLVSLEKTIRRSNVAALSLLPRGRLEPGSEPVLASTLGTPGTLDELLAWLDHRFENVLLDLPSGLGPITRRALALSDVTIVTVSCEPMALRTLPRAFALIDHVRSSENRSLSLLSVVPTMLAAEPASELRDELTRLQQRLGDVCAPPVPASARFVEASRLGQPIQRLRDARPAELRTVTSLTHRLLRLPANRKLTRAAVQHASMSSTRRAGLRSSAGAEVDPFTFLPSGEAPTGFGSAEWSQYLDSCLRASGCETAFVVDDQGLAIAFRGRLRSEEAVERVGIRLMVALEQAERMDVRGSVRCVLVQFDDVWITGIRVRPDSTHSFTLGRVGPLPLPVDLQQRLTASLNEHLSRSLTTPLGAEIPPATVGGETH